MTWLLLCESTETLPSVKMAPGFPPPQSESTDAEGATCQLHLVSCAPHSADHNMHILSSIRKLQTPAQGSVSFSWLGRSLALISSKCLSNISHHFLNFSNYNNSIPWNTFCQRDFSSERAELITSFVIGYLISMKLSFFNDFLSSRFGKICKMLI